jgi:epoxyqueuosine reductase
MELDIKIRDLAFAWGADYYGVADLSPAREAILAQGGPLVAEFPRAVSLGIVLLHSIVDQLPQRAERAVAANYKHHGYDLINERLDQLASRLSGVVQCAGYRALPVPASKKVDDDRICAVFSHKLAAHLAGLGWIGKSCLLVTPEVGPRVRWATVLTDAPLQVTGKPLEERCGTCQQCVEICPPRAFTGQPFRQHEPREARFHAAKCERYWDEMQETREWAVCGLCLYVCPHGRKQGLNQETL